MAYSNLNIVLGEEKGLSAIIEGDLDLIEASRRIRDDFLEQNKYLVLKVPSTVMPEEFNYVLNPLHPDMNRVKITARRKIYFNDRLLRTVQN